jgi:hypothetical protein
MTEIANLIARTRQRDPEPAIALADLVEATLIPPQKTGGALRARRSRGGDSKGEERAKRNDALRDLAQLIGADLSLEQRAQEIIRKTGRYRPAPSDESGSAEAIIPLTKHLQDTMPDVRTRRTS